MKMPKFGEWVLARYPPMIGQTVIVCREGQGSGFYAHRHRDKVTKKVYWTNAIWNYRPIDGITHWMYMPPAYNTKAWNEYISNKN